MKFFILALIWSGNLMASEISEISFGSCWVSETEQLFKFASFKDGGAYQMSGDEIIPLIENFEEDFQEIIAPTKKQVESYLHCGSYGISLVINLSYENGEHVCLWYTNPKSWERVSLGITKKFGPCHGNVPGKYLLSFDPLRGNYKSLSNKVWDQFKGQLLETKMVSSSMMTFTFLKSWYFGGDELHHEFESFIKTNSEVKTIEPVGVTNLSGEFYPIKMFTFSIN